MESLMERGREGGRERREEWRVCGEEGKVLASGKREGEAVSGVRGEAVLW